ncbi:hypothetical protein A6U85_32255 [Agrobacterium sp. 13-626]|jgi:hypothetical protein|nr:hypothetical protein A6U85_32255 [Agrobacterium sp. 13-626]
MHTTAIKGTIFLSHSNKDKTLVEQIVAGLDPVNTFYDIRSMDAGQPTLDAMKHGINATAVFVLFHSPASQSSWVDLEKALAEVQSIVNPATKILVCPINGADHHTLPSWMSKYFTTTSSFKPNDIIRTIRHLYQKYIDDAYPETVRNHPGREVLQRQISLELMRSSATTGKVVNAVVLTGVQGMGRGTLAADLVRESYRNMRQAGPVFEIPPGGDGTDWHLQLFADLAGKLTSDQAEAQKLAFTALSEREQASVLLTALEHWATLNQVVTIRHRWGLRNKGNTLPPWFKELLLQLQAKPQVQLILISERQLPRTEVGELGNVQQFHLEELDSATIQFILTLRVLPRFLDHLRLPDIADKINGHPATANFTAYLINSGRSMESLALAPDAVLAFQDKVLQELYDKNVLSDLQKRILKLLSWFPKLSISIICDAFSEFKKQTVVEELWELADFSLIDQSEGGKYKVPAVVSSTYRRLNNSNDAEIFEKIADILKKQFDDDQLDYDLIESLLLSIVSSDEEISEKLLHILTPGRIEPVVEGLYYEGLSAVGGDAKLSFNRCNSLAKLAMSMKGSDDSIENILFFGADASVRLGIRPDAMIEFMRRRAFVTADYIDASYLFHSNKDFETAAKILSRSLQAAGFKIRNVRLLTRIYLRTAQFQLALDTLNKVSEFRLLRDTGLVMMKVKALRGTRNRSDAQKLLTGIQNKPDDYGEYSTYQASVALREGRFADAIKHVESAKRAPRSNKAILSVLECACEVENGNLTSLAATCTLARAMNREADALQLQARAALAAKDWRSCEEYIQKVNRKDWFDLNVEYRALELKLVDPEIQRDPVLQKETISRQEDLLRQLAGAVEGASFA